ncbi:MULTISPECIES: ricin-type beta-trefoil lectin domain protein [unclassified Streptomyces]|uniref:ricin-type beta-trefoil lectin domain protein n=1 Tax=unclassified Streptomyces TaxID=2593676 RepID=UPI002E180480|nr:MULTISPECIES: ricin-type beta-trefoil lectin domain protein [unclassified Streptomyces]
MPRTPGASAPTSSRPENPSLNRTGLNAPNGDLTPGRVTQTFRGFNDGREYTIEDGTLNVHVPLSDDAKCIVTDKNAANQAPVVVWKCNEIDDNRHASDWRYTNRQLRSADNDAANPMCIDVGGGRANGSLTYVWRCDAGSPNNRNWLSACVRTFDS